MDCNTWLQLLMEQSFSGWLRKVCPSSSPMDPCSYHWKDGAGFPRGVKCANTRVVEINFGDSGFPAGPLPAPILDFTGLTRLDMGDAGLVGTIPDAVGQLTDLTALRIGSNRLNGTIPGAAIRNLKKLQTFGVFRNQLTGLVPELPFAQYTGICAIGPGNHFKCPLPSGSDKCQVTCT